MVLNAIKYKEADRTLLHSSLNTVIASKLKIDCRENVPVCNANYSSKIRYHHLITSHHC